MPLTSTNRAREALHVEQMMIAPLFAFFVRRPEVWLTPPWLISVGVAIGLALLLALAGLCRLAAPRAFMALVELVREGALWWVWWFAVVLTLFATAGFAFAPWQDIFQSLARLPSVGPVAVQQTIPAGALNEPLELPFRLDDLQRLKLASTGKLSIGTRGEGDDQRRDPMRLDPGRPLEWTKAVGIPRLFRPGVEQFVVTNTDAHPAVLTIDAEIGVKYPEAVAVLVALVGFLALVAVYAVQHFAFPIVSAIAGASSKEIMGQWMYWLVLALAFVLVQPFIFPIPGLLYVPFSTFGEDIKMLKDTGLTVVLVAGLVVALWSASTSIFEEVEGRTALTLLSKPVTRRQFIFGKYLGIVWPVTVLFLLLGFTLLVTVSAKVVYDSRELGLGDTVTWTAAQWQVARTAPPLVLKFMETAVLAAVSVAISTRLPMLANLVISVSIYALGHLAPLIVSSAVGKFPAITFMGQLLATVLPVLDHYHVPGAVVGNNEIPLAYLGTAGVYSLVYIAAAILLALALFEDRDLG